MENVEHTTEQWKATVEGVEFSFIPCYGSFESESFYQVKTGDVAFIMRMECANCNFEIHDKGALPISIVTLEDALSDAIFAHDA